MKLNWESVKTEIEMNSHLFGVYKVSIIDAESIPDRKPIKIIVLTKPKSEKCTEMEELIALIDYCQTCKLTFKMIRNCILIQEKEKDKK